MSLHPQEIDLKRLAAGLCRHCGGPVPCWSSFGDQSAGKRHTQSVVRVDEGGRSRRGSSLRGAKGAEVMSKPKPKPVQPELEDVDLIKAAKILCAVFGHPPVVTYCFGYINCARCGEQLGDSLGGAGKIGTERMIIGHDESCEDCHRAEKSLRPIDRLLTEGVRP